MNRQILFDKKWRKFLRKTWLFKHLPFVELVFATGSLALGNVNRDSDFDVLVGVRSGRLYTARFFCLAVADLLDWRQIIGQFNEGICFNHFVTEQAFCLAPPYHFYDRQLYRNLVPIFGSGEKIKEFYLANSSWLDKQAVYVHDLRHRHHHPSRFRKYLEKSLGGRVGDIAERFLKCLQLLKIKQNLEIYSDHNSRICYTDNEVKLWFNPKTFC